MKLSVFGVRFDVEYNSELNNNVAKLESDFKIDSVDPDRFEKATKFVDDHIAICDLS
ncbi:hypothetical protein EOM39_04520 [Candidatus Gracilibacteria bacterium]|nr:hypothetical protein [Candidatus Gracilibacteria bacterium]